MPRHERRTHRRRHCLDRENALSLANAGGSCLPLQPSGLHRPKPYRRLDLIFAAFYMRQPFPKGAIRILREVSQVLGLVRKALLLAHGQMVPHTDERRQGQELPGTVCPL